MARKFQNIHYVLVSDMDDKYWWYFRCANKTAANRVSTYMEKHAASCLDDLDDSEDTEFEVRIFTLEEMQKMRTGDEDMEAMLNQVLADDTVYNGRSPVAFGAGYMWKHDTGYEDEDKDREDE